MWIGIYLNNNFDCSLGFSLEYGALYSNSAINQFSLSGEDAICGLI